MNKIFTEGPSLTMLYGSEIGPEIVRAARKYGVNPADVAAYLEERPEIMGVGENFATVFESIGKAVGQAAPGIGAAVQAIRAGKPIPTTPAATPATAPGMINTPWGQVSPLMIALPIAGILGIMLVKKMAKADKKRK